VKSTLPSATIGRVPSPEPRTLSGLTLEEAMAMQNANQSSQTPQNPQESAPGETKTPVVPSVSPEATKALDLATKAYEASLKISPEELSTQEDIDKLIEATKAGYRATSDQPTPMDFITGQLASFLNVVFVLSAANVSIVVKALEVSVL